MAEGVGAGEVEHVVRARAEDADDRVAAALARDPGGAVDEVLAVMAQQRLGLAAQTPPSPGREDKPGDRERRLQRRRLQCRISPALGVSRIAWLGLASRQVRRKLRRTPVDTDR